jgi:hypothetical protein
LVWAQGPIKAIKPGYRLIAESIHYLEVVAIPKGTFVHHKIGGHQIKTGVKGDPIVLQFYRRVDLRIDTRHIG